MPELPEVETIRGGLDRLIVGKTIRSVTPLVEKSYQASPEDTSNFAINASIAAVRRRAKVLIIDLSTKYSLVIHLKMTGQIVFRGDQDFGAGHPTVSMIGELPDRSTRVIIEFVDGSHLFFNDQRKFGWMKLIPTVEIQNLPFMQKVGPEPLEDDFTLEQFKARFKRKGRSKVKAALLDQTVIAGVGNIYADESLFGAKVHPERLVETLTDQDYQNLYDNVRYTMKLAIKKRGSTAKNYIDSEGNRGNYLDTAWVFRKEGQPCPNCGTTIEKIRVAGRGTHICPSCQAKY